MARAKDNIREDRIIMEAVVDAYGSEERAMGWYYYLDNKINFPFKARCRLVRAISILKPGEQVEVLGMAPEEECETEMFVWIERAGNRLAVPLAQLRPLSKDRDTQEAVEDWLYWVDRGYEM
jgi:Calcium binding